jgi:hypothetical protein
MERIFRRGDETLAVSARREGEKLHLESPPGPRTFTWEELGPGDYLLRQDGRQCALCRGACRRRPLGVDRRSRAPAQSRNGIAQAQRRSRRRAVGADAGASAASAGRAGHRGAQGPVLVVLEAMKMQYEIVAPRDGIVNRCKRPLAPRSPAAWRW